MLSPRLDTRTWIRALVLTGILLSTTASTYFLFKEHAAHESVLKRFGKLTGDPVEQQRPEWAPRVGSLALAKLVFHREAGKEQRTDEIARYFTGAFLVTGICYVLTSATAAPFMLLGTFSALFYCTTERAEDTWYPWDAPALCLAAAALWFALRRRPVALALLCVAAVPFKETLLVMALFLLFMDERPLRTRVVSTALTVAMGVAVRLVIEAKLGAAVEHARFLHVHGKSERPLRILDNLHYVFGLDPNHVLWVNAGLWSLVFLIPSEDRVLSGFRWIAASLYLGLLLAGSFNEFRIFLEALPGSLLLAHRLFAASSLRYSRENRRG